VAADPLAVPPGPGLMRLPRQARRRQGQARAQDVDVPAGAADLSMPGRPPAEVGGGESWSSMAYHGVGAHEAQRWSWPRLTTIPGGGILPKLNGRSSLLLERSRLSSSCYVEVSPCVGGVYQSKQVTGGEE
jgi:hypothetical protein